jgi:hypothetical protein
VLYSVPVVAKTLHIVDGESTGGTLRLAGFRKNGEILCWRDALYAGPVPAGLTLRQLSRLRSRFWTNGKSQTELNKRDALLARQSNYDQVVLWFGPDCMLCQLSLMQILSWFRENAVPSARLSWVAKHGGELSAEQIPDAFASRQPIASPQMRLASQSWRAFRQGSPAGMVRLLKADVSCLPSLRGTLTRLLQEYPARRNGLSRLESELLYEIHSRGRAKAAVAVGHLLVREYVGDVLLFGMLRNFVKASHPLLRYAEPFTGRFETCQFNRSTLELTEVGQRVYAGRADHITLNGIDRWIGGVHLTGHRVPWRWDKKMRNIVRVRT